jgi:hypothetical protein
LKKRSKKLLQMRPAISSTIGTGAGRNRQKFFGSFFQKRTPSFFLLGKFCPA